VDGSKRGNPIVFADFGGSRDSTATDRSKAGNSRRAVSQPASATIPRNSTG